MTRKPQKRSHETKARILEAARELTEGKPFDAVSMDAIARQSGVAKGSLFAHFTDKNGLLSHVVAERLQAIVDDWEVEGTEGGFRLAELLDRSMALVDLLSADRAVLQIYLDYSGATSSNVSAPFSASLEALEDRLFSFLSHWRENGGAPFTLRTDLDVGALAAGVSAFVTTAAIYRACERIGSRDDCAALLESQFTAWLEGPAA
ncbi:MAG: hypothetical protein CMH13_03560 [Martelella sp.]|uniref:TetR/AcrR family transcriptional regulator n=1 Tax=unclassified Martelella TaxID=2629616 RepID=UPI000C4FB3F1|nr:TetR/AcrR family transcriptional regulator [Martelella sp.]MAU19590.1 hypothetical protein [Martelella sp.]